MIVIKTRQPDPELEQKIRMLLEREHIEAEQISIDSWEKLVLPGLTLDNGRKVSLTRLEFDLLLMLASHEGQIFSKEELFRAVWGQNCDDTLKVVANTVSNLRKKLAGCGSFIRTTHGGYAFVSQKENDPA
ncbi:MAG: transcriptional regulator [Faecalibacterium sp. CAG:74_58_120]|nr:MAG: transcriptional regulator [Faecalibacterium sp. CAG:74_58_120]